MAEKIRVIEVTQDTIYESPCCGIKNIEHEGHKRKTNWLKTYFKKGLKAKVLLTEKNIQFGYIEYLPGKYAWRGVEADDYMFIHCIWTYFKKYQRKGYGKFLIQACIDDAQNAPTPYVVFAIFYNGQLLADHQISKSRFRNIMNKIL